MESRIKIERKRNPRATANPISAVLFLYTIPIFFKYRKDGLRTEDLYEELREHKSSILGDKLERLWIKNSKTYKKWALHISLIQLIWFEFFLVGILQLLNEIVSIVITPYAIGGLIKYFSSTTSDVTESEAYMYIGLIILRLIINAIGTHPVMLLMMHICMKMRVACSSLIYRKSLRLSRGALRTTNIGQIVNLLSNDLSKFDEGFILFHYIWIAPIQLAIATYLLYDAIGVSAFSGVGFLLLFIPLQFYLGKEMSVYRLKTALRTDERVRLMDEILNGMQVIKMYAWEKPFQKLVEFIRRYEVKAIRTHFFILSILISFEFFVTKTSIFISIIVFIFLGNKLTADVAYIVTALYNTIKPSINVYFSIGITSAAECYVSVNRVQKLLFSDELLQEHSSIISSDPKDKHEVYPIKIILKNVRAKWQGESSDDTLIDVNLNIEKNQLVVVIGSVGSGKSSLLNVIIKELPILKGNLLVQGIVSYSAQEAWLFSESLRQNILFGEKYDEDRYKAVLKVCALEPDLAMLPYGDRTLVGEKGKSLSGGQKARVNLARCIYKKSDIYLLDDPLSAVDTKVGKQLYEDCIKKFLYDKICILVTHQLQYIKNADKIIILENGKIIGEGTYNFLQTSGLDFAKLLEQFHSGDENVEECKKIKSRQNSEMSVDSEDEDNPDVNIEEAAKGHIKAESYVKYFKAGGHYSLLGTLLLVFLANQGVSSGGDYYLSYWVNLEQDISQKINESLLPSDYESDKTEIISIYSVLTIATIILGVGHLIFFFWVLMQASINIHNEVFAKISTATMTFFNANPIGRILNRFARDIGNIDEYIPSLICDLIEIALLLIGVIVLTCIVNPWLIIPSILLVVLFYFLRLFIISTSRSVKRLEGITRSSILAHTTATLQGLSTIRAFKAQKTLIKEFDQHQDLHSSTWYLFLASNKSFGFWLDLICIFFTSIIMLSLVFVNRDYYGGDIGLIITQYLTLTVSLQWGMRQWTELENNMTSIERIFEYTKVECEPKRPAILNVPINWPEFGKIVFQNVSLKYNADEEPVLKGLTFTVNASEKIGIVGRTGAGKTSTISALFQLYDIQGSIIIDDIDTTQLPLEELRPKISIIPQEPMLFSGTMRKNLDPFEEYDDVKIWNALEQVELKEVIQEMPAGLQSNVSESGSNFSIGQRQLVCLARAIIRSNKVLVMDEATANVDPHTDALIQKTIRKQFANCTVITIAHRLHTIMDSDRVLVMDAGQVVEFDHAYNLLQKTDSLLYAMVTTTGRNASKNLFDIAQAVIILYDMLLECNHLTALKRRYNFPASLSDILTPSKTNITDVLRFLTEAGARPI